MRPVRTGGPEGGEANNARRAKGPGELRSQDLETS